MMTNLIYAKSLSTTSETITLTIERNGGSNIGIDIMCVCICGGTRRPT